MSGKHLVTIKDIATVLKMSHTTVSRALNDRSHISEATKQRVRAAAEELGYVRNLSARMIRGDADLQIGLLIPDVRNDFYAQISKELSELCRRAGLRLLLAISNDDPDLEEAEIRALMEARVSGIIATLSSQPKPSSLACLKTLPLVQLIRRHPDLQAKAICMADRAGCRAATAHLLALGHRRIAYVGTSDTISSGRDRLAGFLDAHEHLGMAASARQIALAPPRQEDGFAAVRRILANPDHPTALLIGSSELTIGGLRAIREAGLSVPRDISVAGYGDPVWFELLTPPLTAVRLPVSALAASAAQVLFHQLGIVEPTDAEVTALTTIDIDLIVRGSTAPLQA